MLSEIVQRCFPGSKLLLDVSFFFIKYDSNYCYVLCLSGAIVYFIGQVVGLPAFIKIR